MKPEQSMQHLVSSLMEVTGTDQAFEKTRPGRNRRILSLGKGASLKELRKIGMPFMRDVAVLAYPGSCRQVVHRECQPKDIEGVVRRP